MAHNRFKVSNQFFLYFFSDHFAAFSQVKKNKFEFNAQEYKCEAFVEYWPWQHKKVVKNC